MGNSLAENADMIVILLIVLVLIVIAEAVSIIVMHKKYISFMKKLGNGNNLDELLKIYISDVENVKKDNSEIKNYDTIRK